VADVHSILASPREGRKRKKGDDTTGRAGRRGDVFLCGDRASRGKEKGKGGTPRLFEKGGTSTLESFRESGQERGEGKKDVLPSRKEERRPRVSRLPRRREREKGGKTGRSFVTGFGKGRKRPTSSSFRSSTFFEDERKGERKGGGVEVRYLAGGGEEPASASVFLY